MARRLAEGYCKARWVEAVRWLLLCACLAWAGLGAASARAADNPLLERAYWRDNTGHRTLEEVQGQTFTPYRGLLTQGYQRDAVYWLRFKVRGGDVEASPYVLRLRPFWHDDFQLFDSADPRTTPRLAGDRHPWSAKEFDSLSHAFVLRRIAEDRYVYVRVKTAHTYLIQATLQTPEEAWRSDWALQTLYLVYIGLMAIVLVWAVVELMARPERVLAAFAVFLVCQIVYCAALVGLIHQMLARTINVLWIERVANVSIMVFTFATFRFHRILLGEYPLRRGMGVTLLALSYVPLACLALWLAGESTWAYTLNSVGVLLFTSVACATVWWGVQLDATTTSERLPLWAVRAFYTLMVLVAVLGVPMLGLYNATEATLQVFIWYGVYITLMMAILLKHRARRRAERQIERLARARQKVEQQRRAWQEQNQFMSMLNHELKTPMSVLKLLVAGQPIQTQAEAHIDTMANLLERCMQSDRFESQPTVAVRHLFTPQKVLSEAIARTQSPERVQLACSTARTVEGDPDLYGVVVFNLLDNALKYAPPQSPITVSLVEVHNPKSRVLCLTVDNAIGRAGAPDPTRVFDKYYRAESAKLVPGTGLGLYLVKSFAELMGGEVRCELPEGLVRFAFCLPC